jgi:ammonia channel protein AmtB
MMIPTTLVNIKDTQGEHSALVWMVQSALVYFGWIVFNVRRYCEKEESLSSLDLRSYKTY